MKNVKAGVGKAQLSLSRMEGLQRCQRGSLAAWMSSAANDDLSDIKAILLGDLASDDDVDLLRFHVSSHQVIVCSLVSKAADKLIKNWGGLIYRAGQHLIFADPGRSFQDPADYQISEDEAKLWPKISVVTVSYNQSEFLERCLQSVLRQDYPNLEYIVIDAVSNDGSQEILRRYEPQLTRLIIEKDQGQSDGLNKGFSYATGEILTWINSDDALAPHALKRAAAVFACTGADIVAGGCDRIDAEDRLLTRHHSALPFAKVVPLGIAHQYVWSSSWFEGDYFYQPEVLFTARIWREAGASLKLHLYWAMDWELWIRMALAGASVVHIPATIGQSREHLAQKTTGDELYLYQLKNILLEHDEAVTLAEQAAAEAGLAAGPFRVFNPGTRVPVPAGQFDRFLTAIGRLYIVNVVRRVWAWRDASIFAEMLRNRLRRAGAGIGSSSVENRNAALTSETQDRSKDPRNE